MTVKDRLLAYVESRGITRKAFEANSGLSNGYLNNFKGNIGAAKLESILSANPELNRIWLLTGEGEMLNPTTMPTTEVVDIAIVSENDEIGVDIDSLMRTWHTTPENFANIIGETIDFVRSCNGKLLPRHIMALQQHYGDAVVDRYAKYPKQSKAEVTSGEQLKKTVVLTPDIIRDPKIDIKAEWKAGKLDEYAKPAQDILPLHHAQVYTYCDDMDPEIKAGEPVLVRLLPKGVAITPGEMYFVDLPRGSKIRYIEKEEEGKLYLKARNSAYGDIVVDREEVQSLAQVVVILRTPRSMSNKETILAEAMVRKDAHLSDMLANNNKLIDELCKQNERTGRMIDRLMDKS